MRLAKPIFFTLALLALAGAIVLSLFVGSKVLDPTLVWQVLRLGPDTVNLPAQGVQSEQHSQLASAATVVWQLRVPRTLIGLSVGAALGLAGALMQCLTRNPLADPGILGVNSGAALAVVLSVALFGLSGVNTYMWAAFMGAGAAAVAVYLLGATGRAGANPVRLALAGVAVSAALGALTQTVILADQEAFNEFRYWVAGSLEGRGADIAMATTPLIVLGAALGLVLSPSLNALALGEEAAKGLGVRVEATRTLTALAVTLLAGTATAAAGPISFVGLAVPVAARTALGPDQRWVALASLLLGPVWVLGADVLARVIIAPQELQVGVVAALAGAPCFIAMVRTKKVAAL